MRLIILIACLLSEIGCAGSRGPVETVPLTVSARLEGGWSWASIPAKQEYREQHAAFMENSWLMRGLLSVLGLEPRPPVAVAAGKPLSLELRQDDALGDIAFAQPGKAEGTFRIDADRPVEIVASQGGNRQLLVTLQPPIPARVSIVMADDSVTTY